MKHGAQPNPKMATPPSSEVMWHCEMGERTFLVQAKSWFQARAMAMARLGCEPHEVTVREVVAFEQPTRLPKILGGSP